MIYILLAIVIIFLLRLVVMQNLRGAEMRLLMERLNYIHGSSCITCGEKDSHTTHCQYQEVMR